MSAPPRPPDTGVSPISPAWAPGIPPSPPAPADEGHPRALGVLPLRIPCSGGAPGAAGPPAQRRVPPAEVDIPCTAYKYSMSNPRIEWKFQKGTSLVLLYYGNELTGTRPPPAAPPGLPVGGFFPLRRLPPDPPALPAEPYKNRVQFTSTNIRFSTVTREDTGKYICEVVDGSSQISKSEVSLIVQGAPLAPPHPRSAALSVPESPLPPPPRPRCHSEGASWGGTLDLPSPVGEI